MKRIAFPFITLFILLGFYSANAQSLSKKNCVELLDFFMRRSEVRNVVLTYDSPHLSNRVKILVSSVRDQYDISSEEMHQLLKALNDYNGEYEVSSSEIKDFLDFTETLMPKKRLNAFESISEYLTFMEEYHKPWTVEITNGNAAYENYLIDQYVTSPEMRKFISSKRKIERRYRRFYDDLLARAEKDGDVDYGAIRREAVRKRNQYKKLFYGCRARKANPINSAAKADFKKFVYFLGVGVGAFAYWDKHKEEEKTFGWYGKFLHELAWFKISSSFRAKNMGDPNLSFGQKALRKIGFSRFKGIFKAISFGMFFGVSDEKVQNRLASYTETDEDFETAKSIASEVLQDKTSLETIVDDFFSNAEEVLASAGLLKETKVRYRDYDDVDWDNLTREDLRDPRIRNLMLKSMSMDIYRNEESGEIQTGYLMTDTYIFHSVYAVAMLFKEMAVDITIFTHILCMGQGNKVKAFTTALLVYTFQRYLSDKIYYHYRDKYIKQ